MYSRNSRFDRSSLVISGNLSHSGFSKQAIRTTLKHLVAALLATAAVSISPAQAQSIYSPGGLFVHPTAFVPPAHKFSSYTAGFTQDEAGGVNNSYYPVTFTYTPTDRLQVSALAVHHQASDEATHTHLGAFLKYQLLPDAATHPAFAITGSFVGHDHMESSAAAVTSHSFLRGDRALATLHLGAKWGRTKEQQGGANDFGGFVGTQVPLSRQWNLVGETSTRLKFDRSSATSVGVMYHDAKSGLGISVGLVNGGRSSRMKFFFGVGVPLGF